MCLRLGNDSYYAAQNVHSVDSNVRRSSLDIGRPFVANRETRLSAYLSAVSYLTVYAKSIHIYVN